jgi:hypothetical protein
MKSQLLHISVFQSAKVMAVLYFVISIPLVLIMAIPTLLMNRPGPGLFMLILMPILYLILGFLFSAFGAWVYNLVAARIGGFEFTVLPENQVNKG